MRKSDSKNDPGFKQLRKFAEKSLSKRFGDLRQVPVEDSRELIHELRVHQIELEMQNEELRKAQVELAESRDRYFDLYDFAPVGYFTLDQNGLIVEMNLAGADMLGFERRSLIKKGFSRFVAPSSQDVFYSHRKQALETGTKQFSEVELNRKDGQSRYVQLQSVAARRNEGNATHLRMAVIDTTERKRAEVALIEAYRQLEGRVSERTADLMAANADLQKEMESGKRIGEALKKSENDLHHLSSQLLGVLEIERRRVALELHDSIAQTLVAARMFLKLALDAPKNGPSVPGISVERIYSMLGDCIEELRGIIDGLRPSVLEDLGVSSAVDSYCAKFQRLNPRIKCERVITVKDEVIPKELKIVIYRILQEALSNVSRHSQAKTVKVFLRGGNDRIELSIEDDGGGFDKEHLQSDGSGLGIGLSSMKERARLSGGSMSIQSQKGIGTTVSVSWHY